MQERTQITHVAFIHQNSSQYVVASVTVKIDNERVSSIQTDERERSEKKRREERREKNEERRENSSESKILQCR